MSIIKSLLGKTPEIGNNCFLAENSVLIGDLTLGNNCSIWFGAVIRADVNYIKIGNKVNIQDNATIHCTYKTFPTEIGDNVSIGHNAIVHGCIIHNDVLIGMQAVVMDGCIVESNSIIAAGSVLTQNTHVKSGEIWAGVPAVKIKDISQELIENQIKRIADNYIKYSSWYKK